MNFQYFSLTSNDNNPIRMAGFTEGPWVEVTMNAISVKLPTRLVPVSQSNGQIGLEFVPGCKQITPRVT